MPANPDWYRTLFTGLMVEAQRRFPRQTAAEAEFILKVLEPRPGAKILDVPCGNGRLSLALAEKGFHVTGVDLCEELLNDARKSANEKKLEINFDHRDMRDLPRRNEFEGVYCWGNSFAYLGDDGDRAFLEAVFHSLKPGGRFALETGVCAESVLINRLQRAWFPLGDLYFLVDTEYDPAAGTLTSSYTAIQNDRQEKHQATYRVYTYRQIAQTMSDIGFADIRSYGSMDQAPYALGSPRLYLVATKPS